MLLALAFIFLLFTASQVQAAETGLVLNEISAYSSDDWVELYNGSDSEVDLAGWQLKDSGSTTMKTLTSGTTISAKNFLVVEVSSRLNKNGDKVRLINNSGVEEDTFQYSSTNDGKSFKRIPDGTGKWYETSGFTKGATNGNTPPKSPPAVRTGQIVLSEFMPNPDGGNEWVEVYNPNSFEVDSGNWKIDDIDGGSSPFTIPGNTKIKARGYKVFSFSSKLNNSGDTIRLLDPNGKVVEKYSFAETEEGVAFAKDSGGSWKLTTTPTPGSSNKITYTQNGSIAGSSDTSASAEDGDEESSPSAYFDQEIGNYTDSGESEGRVAGITKAINENNKLSTLSIAAGFSLILTALVWPFIEKRFLRKPAGKSRPAEPRR